MTVTVTVNTCELTRHNSACGKELRSRVTDQKARNLSSIGHHRSIGLHGSDPILQILTVYTCIHDGTGWKMVENDGK